MKQLPGNSFDGTPITTISIGNELVDMGKASVGDVVSALETARGILGNAGFKGSIVTVDTFNALIQNPKLCEASDFCAANAHSYFDPTITPDQAGAWLRKQVARISDAVGGAKKVVITETGWPHAGRDNGIAHPGKEEQRTAMESVKGEWGKESWGGMFLFSAFDDKWKQPGPWEVERNWGIN